MNSNDHAKWGVYNCNKYLSSDQWLARIVRRIDWIYAITLCFNQRDKDSIDPYDF